MAIKITINNSPWEKIRKELIKADNSHLSVGWFPSAQYGSENENLSVATVAHWMEEGIPSKGVPPRPFLRQGFLPRLRTAEYQKVFESVLRSVLSGRNTFKAALTYVGKGMVRGIQNEIVSWDSPPNSPLTVELKGFNNPLIDTGKMLESVDFEVERRGV